MSMRIHVRALLLAFLGLIGNNSIHKQPWHVVVQRLDLASVVLTLIIDDTSIRIKFNRLRIGLGIVSF